MSDFIKVLEKKMGGVFGLMRCIPEASEQLGLSNDQILAFCRATPNGEELWRQFTSRRDSPGMPDDYNFCSFMADVLADIDRQVHPVANEYPFPIWGTQGGGIVRESGSGYIFVTKPDCPDLDIGDAMPDEWGLIPANDLATEEEYATW